MSDAIDKTLLPIVCGKCGLPGCTIQTSLWSFMDGTVPHIDTRITCSSCGSWSSFEIDVDDFEEWYRPTDAAPEHKLRHNY